jgi:hypothetical protein
MSDFDIVKLNKNVCGNNYKSCIRIFVSSGSKISLIKIGPPTKQNPLKS